MMSDFPKTYSEREKVLAQREAFKTGVYWQASSDTRSVNEALCFRYPLPKVTRPREVLDADGHQWKWANGQLYFRPARSIGTWLQASPPMIGESARNALADLLANPTEEVEAEP